MKIFEYEKGHFEEIYNVVHNTIEKIYPKYYPRNAVDFFHKHHSEENMLEKLPNEYTKIIIENGMVIGTGSVKDNEIGRFFILPEYQNQGYGKILLKELENKIIQNKYKEITLSSSLGAVFFYRKCGYKYYDYKIIPVENGENLCYLEMVKEIKNIK
ncbi:MAG: GNAT family N-acetyltransferase [Treponema sp.]|jgi:GNAT superfamily N-acetyltransferase|nr:GNAT family N-acetyltransferase [Treponema sp.]